MVRADSFVPNGVTMKKTMGIRILHFSYVIPVIQISCARNTLFTLEQMKLQYSAPKFNISLFVGVFFFFFDNDM